MGTFPLPRGSLPAFLPWHGSLWYPRDHIQLHHEVRCGHPQGSLCQHCHVRRHHHVPWYCRPYAEGNHCSCSFHHQDQDHCSTREEVLCLDRRIHPCLPLYLISRRSCPSGISQHPFEASFLSCFAVFGSPCCTRNWYTYGWRSLGVHGVAVRGGDLYSTMT